MLRWEILDTRLLSDNWAELKTSKLRLTFADGHSVEQWLETYDRGDGAAILPYDPARGHVLLIRQFRWPAAYRGDKAPFLIESAAGKLDGADPEACIRHEAQEELRLEIGAPERLFSLYSSPGSITEQITYFVARYDAGDVSGMRGGLRSEGEETEILDLRLSDALTMVADGRIRDAKTVILLHHAALYLMPEAQS